MITNIPLNVNPDLLYAFAQTHDGEQFEKSELRCRIATAETDEGYPTNHLDIQFFAER